MSDLPTAGTFRLDGMLQGPLPPDADGIAGLEAWVAAIKSNGLHLHLRVEGGSYSLVADPAVRKTSTLKGDDLEPLLTDRLQTLLDRLPPDVRSRAFSTLRSEEFRPDTAVQTLYAVGPDGRIHAEQRTVDVETARAAPEITASSLRRVLLPGLVALLLVLFISSFFIDYRQLLGEARDQIAPLKKEELTIRQEIAAEILRFELVEVDRKKNALVFRITRGPGWAAAMEAAPADAVAMDWPDYITVLAIRHGRCRIALFNKDGEQLVSREVAVADLREKESIEIALVTTPRDRIATAVLQP